jgi:hypothetical protein
MENKDKIPTERIELLDDKLNGIFDNLNTITNQLVEIGNSITELTNRRYIVEAWNEGSSWYRVWSDGWIEQGGVFDAGSFIQDMTGKPITFYKPFSNTSYSVFGTSVRYDRDGQSNGLSSCDVSFYTFTTTGCYIRWYMSGGNESARYATWKACGY